MVSERPWSDYTKADYSIEQWHAACLIHQHTGPPTSKEQCKLPVRTPGGAVNRNGVYAAAAALAGARGGVNASAEEKAKASAAIRRLYSQLGKEPPESIRQDAMGDDTYIQTGEELSDLFLEHFGVKGMRWGVRNFAQRTAARKTKRQIEVHKDVLSNTGAIGLASRLDKYTWGGSGRFEGYHNKRISELERSVERIESGELLVRTMLFGPQYSKK